MSDEWAKDPRAGHDEIDKGIESIKRIFSQGQGRVKRVIDKAGDYWQQAQAMPTPHQAVGAEEQRIRRLVDLWSNENWRVAKDLGTYMDLVSYNTDEVWEITLQTRWETRNMESVTEPYKGRSKATMGQPQPLLPVWDYELPVVTGLKAPPSRTRLEGLDETIACTNCNGTGRALCSTCNGRGWIVCPECKGRIKKRCATCRGRGYVADWTQGEKKPFFRRQAENMANSVGERVADVFEGIRQQGVPIPNPVDTDPASKGPTVPCPDCVNGEVDCTCGNGKRVCSACEGARMALCSHCAGTGKLMRHRELVRRFDLRTQTRVIGESSIPQQQLAKAVGEMVYSTEVTEPLYPQAPPENVPMDVWGATVDLMKTEGQQKPGNERPDSPLSSVLATLQVVELLRISYTKVQYRYSDQDYVLYIYDGEGCEKVYAERFPARWDRVERLVRAISNDLVTATPEEPSSNSSHTKGYRAPTDTPPYNITEEEGTL
ncbi:MAG: hypothetical protein JO183_09900 [Ktedonobacteraceae bacterium]|nr:hypothetical protein [Ktedonobacteraceae bacterium]MBV8822351.1 hypothetical protein [Ktedonobacteraceae bacterium]MBV9021994.1 hypothetical protein [Ktedonobacteraceae bacterium]